LKNTWLRMSRVRASPVQLCGRDVQARHERSRVQRRARRGLGHGARKRPGVAFLRAPMRRRGEVQPIMSRWFVTKNAPSTAPARVETPGSMEK